MLNRQKPLELLILDSFGYSPEKGYNVIAAANTPCWDKLQKVYPMSMLDILGVPQPVEKTGRSLLTAMH